MVNRAGKGVGIESGICEGEVRNKMDYEDTSRVLNQMWDQEPHNFIKWIKENQPKILNYLSFNWIDD